MLDTPPSTPTRKLFADFVEELSELASLETRLFRAELKETSSKLVTATGLLVAAIILAFGGFLTLLAAAALLLVRLRVPPDLACFIVAVLAFVLGGALLLTARHTVSGKMGVPRSLRQLSMLRLK
ncbi:MAG: phage holin family protein [Hyphomicrobiales bacterium]|nr:phage holin family protein [Hyphomicrobiales bacterium]MBV8767480.1 phage holin family protein [Hyphomicrobiales bacterium]MBV9052636.1 phage holin family protein [Hyphomicrobiales bacterium]MBV9590168.1 phage holin family protein [Hyphomicrobiales bacterium]MBV9973886.1 phage holin family protein [Hyphomicrobiales bacterium]